MVEFGLEFLWLYDTSNLQWLVEIILRPIRKHKSPLLLNPMMEIQV